MHVHLIIDLFFQCNSNESERNIDVMSWLGLIPQVNIILTTALGRCTTRLLAKLLVVLFVLW